ncbi:MAG: hypothetical protein AB7T49_01225 [Oligoflexales bacterium]
MKAGKNIVSRILVLGTLILAATVISCGAQTNSHTKDEPCDNDDWTRKMQLGQEINDIIDEMDALDCGTEGDPMECTALSTRMGHIRAELSALSDRCFGE